MFFADIKNSLKTQWTLQLYKEYENICFQYKTKLKKPLIVLSDLKNIFGQWNPQTKTITISIELVQNYSWDIVINILKHEIAHQIVTEIFSSTDSHSQDFIKACELIGIPEEFRKATLHIDNACLDWKKEKNIDEDEGILRKLEKLLTLAQSSNEHEAFSAMDKVQELYTKYNINKIVEGLKSDFYTLIINFKKKKTPRLHTFITSILQDHYFVQVIYSDLYDAQTNESHKIINLLGTKHNVLMAEYVFFFLVNRSHYLWENYKKEKKVSARYKSSYVHGLITGFHHKLDQIRESKVTMHTSPAKEHKNVHALVKLENQKLREFTKTKFPRLTTRISSTSLLSREHYDIGKSDGHRITLNKGMHSSKQNEKRLLTS